MNFKRIFSLFLVFAMLVNYSSLAAFNAERNKVAQITVHPISPGLDYTSTIEICDGLRREIKSFTYEPESATKIIPAYGQYIYGFNSVGELVSDYDGSGRLVGGINTDFFITSTGIPLSCFIADREIISSCDNRPAIGFDGKGKAFIGYPNIRASLKNDNLELSIAHINKTPAVWGLYLVTDTFAKTTKSSVESIEIVFKSYDKEKTENAVEEYFSSMPSDKRDIPISDVVDVKDKADSEEIEAFESYADAEEDGEILDQTINIASEDSDDNTFESSTKSERQTTYTNDVSDSEEINEGELVEIDAEIDNSSEDAKELESESEKDISNETSKDEEELNADDSETNSKLEIPIELYVMTEEAVSVNSSIDVVVTEIRDGIKNGDIPKDSFVLCVPKEQFGYMVNGLKVGDCFSLETDCNDEFYDAENIFGAGSIILENGEFVKQPNDSIYIYRNPRTAAGIKDDGTVVFVCVDGRRPGVSDGFTAAELAEYLRSLGCVDAVNFDGGGSTTFYAADIGEENANLKNTPSEKSERRVANGMLFVNTAAPSEKRTYATLSPKHFLTFNKGVITDISGKVSFADSNGFPMEPLSHESVILTVDERFGFTHNGYFVPNGKAGRAEIIANIPESEETYYVGFIEITDTVDSLKLKTDDDFLTPFEGSSGLSVSPSLYTIPVNFTHRSVEWKIETENEEDEKLEYSEVDESEAYLYVNDSTIRFVPVLRDAKYRITASMGDYSESIDVFAEAHPFADMENHWASMTSYEMFKKGLILGELSDDGSRSFMPSRNMTRAEFCTVLARILNLDVSAYSHLADKALTDENEVTTESEDESELYDADGEYINIDDSLEIITDTDELSGLSEFSDEDISESVSDSVSKTDGTIIDEGGLINQEKIVEDVEENNKSEAEDGSGQTDSVVKVYNLSDVPEWARGYVYALYTEGYIDDLVVEGEDGELTIYAYQFITRADVIRVLGSLLEGDGDPEALERFPDFVPALDDDTLYFSRIIGSGIIGGYEDGTVRADGSLTRAEAATVFSRFIAKFE